MSSLSTFHGETPRCGIVRDDTYSRLLAAKPPYFVVHVEAGPRSFERRTPEEPNRGVTDHMSDLQHARTAVANARRERLSQDRVRRVAIVVADGALLSGRRAEERRPVTRTQDHLLSPRHG